MKKWSWKRGNLASNGPENAAIGVFSGGEASLKGAFGHNGPVKGGNLVPLGLEMVTKDCYCWLQWLLLLSDGIL